MAGRPKIFDEQEAVEKATEVFRNKGYDIASTDELLEAMKIGKGSFYLAFKGGKQELYIRSIQQFAGKFLEKLTDEIAKSENEIEFIKQFFLSQAETPDCDREKGCYLGNALVQLSGKDGQIKLISAQLLEKLQKFFFKIIEKAQLNRKIKNTENPNILAWHLTNLWNGIHVTKRMENSSEILRSMIELNLKILD